MTTVEAVEAFDHCVHILSDGVRPNSFALPESMLPPGGFPAVVEGFARFYVHRHPLEDDPDVADKLAGGVAILALSAPDWTIRVEQAFLQAEPEIPSDKGMRAAQEFGNELQHLIEEAQLRWGREAFRQRIEELRAEKAGR